MKKLLLLFLIITAVHADSDKTITIGAGSYVQTQPYKNVDAIVLPTPIIFYDNGILYVRWTRVGVYFLGSKGDDFSWGVSLTALPRIYGYESSDIIGMQERKKSWEGGVAFSSKAGKYTFEAMYLTDILNDDKNWVLSTELGTNYKVGKLSLYPSLIAIYQSSNFTNYYYGVDSFESTQNRAAYTPKAGIQIGAQSFMKYPLTKELSTLANMRIDRLSKQAINSPLTDKKYIYSGMISLIYTLNY